MDDGCWFELCGGKTWFVKDEEREEIANCEMHVVARIFVKPSDKVHFQGTYLVRVRFPPDAPSQGGYIEMTWEQLGIKAAAQKMISSHFRYHVRFECSDTNFITLVEKQLAVCLQQLQDINLATHVGRQPGSTIYVFSNIQFGYDGKPTNMLESGYMWPLKATTNQKKSPVPTLAAGTNRPLVGCFEQVLKWGGEQACISVLVMTAAAVVALRNRDHNTPVLLLQGPPGAGKTFLARCGLSVFGQNWAMDGMISDATEAGFMQNLDWLGSLPFCWNDPQPNSKDVEVLRKTIIHVYDQAVVSTAKHSRQYNAALWVTCNTKFLQQLLASEQGEEKPTAERCVILEMPKLEKNPMTPQQEKNI